MPLLKDRLDYYLKQMDENPGWWADLEPETREFVGRSVREAAEFYQYGEKQKYFPKDWQ